MGLARAFADLVGPSKITDPDDGRLGWFEGLREDKLCGWTYLPGALERTFEVTLAARGGASLRARADRLRADLQVAGHGHGYYGFAAPIDRLPGASRGVTCVWSDLGLPLPGGPWSPARRVYRRIRSGPITLTVDRPAPGDPRLTGAVFDRRDPFRRVRLSARSTNRDFSFAVASLFRRAGFPGRADDFHGFILALPAPLALLQEGVEIFDDDRNQRLARLNLRRR